MSKPMARWLLAAGAMRVTGTWVSRLPARCWDAVDARSVIWKSARPCSTAHGGLESSPVGIAHEGVEAEGVEIRGCSAGGDRVKALKRLSVRSGVTSMKLRRDCSTSRWLSRRSLMC